MTQYEQKCDNGCDTILTIDTPIMCYTSPEKEDYTFCNECYNDGGYADDDINPDNNDYCVGCGDEVRKDNCYRDEFDNKYYKFCGDCLSLVPDEETKCETDKCDMVGLCNEDKCYYESEERNQ